MLDRNKLTRDQDSAIAHIKAHPKAALWMGMGTGKSVTGLTGFNDLRNSFDTRHMLVSAPLRVARDVWDDEINKWAHLQGLTVSKIVGSKQNRLDAIKVPADIHTINRENLAWLFSGYVEEITKSRFKQIRKWPWDWLTLDEAQSYKNQSAVCSRTASRISTFGLASRILELTGTPSPKGYGDIWHQMFILDHGQRLGRTEKAFRERWFNPPPDWGFKWTLKDGAAEEIQSLIKDIVLAIPDAQPPVPVNPIYVTLSPAALRQYKKLERTSVLELADTTITAANAGVLGQKLLQLASGAMYTDGKGSFEQLHDAKLDALCDALDELCFSGPVLVGYGFIHELKRIGKRLSGRRWEQLRSAESMKAFSRGEIDIGIVHPASAGHGLNDLYLSGSENLIWFGPTNNLEHWDQLAARLTGGHRRTGKTVCIQVILVRGTVDEDYMQMLKSKDMDQVGLMKALRARV